MRQRRMVLPLVVVLLVTVACQHQVVPHPNQLSTLDGQAYDALVTAQAAITEARGQFTSGNLPAQSKPVLNGAIAVYNSTQAAWKTYRAILAGKQAGDANLATVQLTNFINQLNTSIAQLKALGGK